MLVADVVFCVDLLYTHFHVRPKLKLSFWWGFLPFSVCSQLSEPEVAELSHF